MIVYSTNVQNTHQSPDFAKPLLGDVFCPRIEVANNLEFMQVTEKIYIENCDCMELMARYPDNYFDLAIVDPPYGIGASDFISKDSGNKRKNSAAKKGVYKIKD